MGLVEVIVKQSETAKVERRVVKTHIGRLVTVLDLVMMQQTPLTGETRMVLFSVMEKHLHMPECGNFTHARISPVTQNCR